MTRNATHTMHGRADLDEIGAAELYETPVAATRALCRADPWLRAQPRMIWDPACGPGAIVEAVQAEGHKAKASDLYKYEGRWRGKPGTRRRWGHDFLKVNPAHRVFVHDAIIMNPPYSIKDDFLLKAMDVSPRVYALLEVTWLQGGTPARDVLLDSPHWIGFYPFRERLNEMHRDGFEGRKSDQPRRHAWFVFGRIGTPDGPKVRRLSLQGGVDA